MQDWPRTTYNLRGLCAGPANQPATQEPRIHASEGIMKKLPRDAYGYICYQCSELRREGYNDKQLAKEHDDCHGWFHCYECCGPCIVCGEQGAATIGDDD